MMETRSSSGRSRDNSNTFDEGVDKEEGRVIGGKKAAETRKQREGEDVFQRMGEKGAKQRSKLFQEGRLGTSGFEGATGEYSMEGVISWLQNLDTKDPRRVEAGKKAAETRKEQEGDDVFERMGQKGGKMRAKNFKGQQDSEEGIHQQQGGRGRRGSNASKRSHRDEEDDDDEGIGNAQGSKRQNRGKQQRDGSQKQSGGRGSRGGGNQQGDEDEEDDEDDGGEWRENHDDKDPSRVEGGQKAAQTRKQREGDDVFKKMGRKGAEARGFNVSDGEDGAETDGDNRGGGGGRKSSGRGQQRGGGERRGSSGGGSQSGRSGGGSRGGGGKGGNDEDIEMSEEEIEEARSAGKDPSRVLAGKKAAQTRKQQEGDDVFSKMGRKGAQARSASAESGEDAEESRVEAGRKAAQTRKEKEGDDVFRRMGQKGGKARWGQSGNDDEE